jgi:hypothetical protein
LLYQLFFLLIIKIIVRGNVKNLSIAGKKDTKSDSEKLAELMGQEFNPSHGR